MDLASRDTRRRIIWSVVSVVIGSLIVATTILTVLHYSSLSMFSITGDSMDPTVKNGQTVVLKTEETFVHNQIVFFDRPDSWTYDEYRDLKQHTFVKRLVAIPGDTLRFDGDNFYVNDNVVFNLSENNYICQLGDPEYSHMLDQDEFFVIGDNALASFDSRRVFCDGGSDIFYVPRDNIKEHGHVLLQY